MNKIFTLFLAASFLLMSFPGLSDAAIDPTSCGFTQAFGLSPEGDVRSRLQDPNTKILGITTLSETFKILGDAGAVRNIPDKNKITRTLSSTKTSFEGPNECLAKQISQMVFRVPGKKKRLVKFDVTPLNKALFVQGENLKCGRQNSSRDILVNDRKFVGISQLESSPGGVFIAEDPCGNDNGKDPGLETSFISPTSVDATFTAPPSGSPIDLDDRITLTGAGQVNSKTGTKIPYEGSKIIISKIEQPIVFNQSPNVSVAEQDFYLFEIMLDPGTYSIDVASAPTESLGESDEFLVTLYNAELEDGEGAEDPTDEDGDESNDLASFSCNVRTCPSSIIATNNLESNEQAIIDRLSEIEDFLSKAIDDRGSLKITLIQLANRVRKAQSDLAALDFPKVQLFLNRDIQCIEAENSANQEILDKLTSIETADNEAAGHISTAANRALKTNAEIKRDQDLPASPTDPDKVILDINQDIFNAKQELSDAISDKQSIRLSLGGSFGDLTKTEKREAAIATLQDAAEREACMVDFFRSWLKLSKNSSGLQSIEDFLILNGTDFRDSYDISVDELNSALNLAKSPDGGNQKTGNHINKAIRLDTNAKAFYERTRSEVADQNRSLTAKKAKATARREVRLLNKAIKFKNAAIKQFQLLNTTF